MSLSCVGLSVLVCHVVTSTHRGGAPCSQYKKSVAVNILASRQGKCHSKQLHWLDVPDNCASGLEGGEVWTDRKTSTVQVAMPALEVLVPGASAWRCAMLPTLPGAVLCCPHCFTNGGLSRIPCNVCSCAAWPWRHRHGGGWLALTQPAGQHAVAVGRLSCWRVGAWAGATGPSPQHAATRCQGCRCCRAGKTRARQLAAAMPCRLLEQWYT